MKKETVRRKTKTKMINRERELASNKEGEKVTERERDGERSGLGWRRNEQWGGGKEIMHNVTEKAIGASLSRWIGIRERWLVSMHYAPPLLPANGMEEPCVWARSLARWRVCHTPYGAGSLVMTTTDAVALLDAQIALWLQFHVFTMCAFQNVSSEVRGKKIMWEEHQTCIKGQEVSTLLPQSQEVTQIISFIFIKEILYRIDKSIFTMIFFESQKGKFSHEDC